MVGHEAIRSNDEKSGPPSWQARSFNSIRSGRNSVSLGKILLAKTIDVVVGDVDHL